MYKHASTAGLVLFLIASLGFASLAEARQPSCDRRQSAKICRPPTTNTAPTISGVPPDSAITGQNYLFQPSISDKDGDTLTATIVNRPPWAAFNSSTGRLSGMPGPSNVGEYVDILISVSDGVTTASLPAFAIDVQAAVTQYQLSVTVQGPGSVVDAGHGINCAASCSYTFAAGLTLNLTPQPASGAHFVSWSGACSSAGSCALTVSGATSLGATFAADSTSPPPPPPPPSTDMLVSLLNFAETWDRNWNFDGHTVTSAFTESYGFWDYTNTTYEPWLFDRATVGYRLYELTGDTRWRDQFLSDFAWYRARIDANGIFTPKGNDDTKYGYVTPFLLYERLTGDTQYRPIAKRIYDSWIREWPNDFNPNTLFWTEREMAFSLEAAVSWYEITGDSAALSRASALVNQWTVASGSAGAPLVTYTQHEGGGPGGTTPTNLTNSPWMSALYFQALRRYYDLTNDSQALAQVSRYADWCQNNCYYDAALVHVEYTGLVFPRYLTGELIGDAGYDYGNMGHCLDVQGLLRFALFAKQRRGESQVAVQNRYAQMQACATRDFQEWTRDTAYLPKYRVNPPRKFNWQLRGYYEVAQ